MKDIREFRIEEKELQMITRAVKEDIPQLQEIYNDAILHTTATFDTEVKDDKNRMEWFLEHEEDPYVILVEKQGDVVVGYASLSRYRDRKAFDRTVEISVYIHRDYRGCGVGSRLMEETLAWARAHSRIHTVISLITGDNAPSIHLHEKYGFVFCGQQKQVGYKFGRWMDLNAYQLMLEEPVG